MRAVPDPPDALTATIDLPPEIGSVPAARRVLTELLGSWAAEHFRDDANLLLSELVTNVVRHVSSRSKMVLEVRLSGPGLRVAVIDVSADLPTVTGTPSRAAGGHGMLLVAALADRWGSENHASGKRVWFELRGA
jgi:anti-sigma regulatory factor (Ser/Thr protein kinase)